MNPVVPLPALAAEIQAFPLTSEAAWQLGITRLAYSSTGVLDPPTEQLAQAMVMSLLPRAGGMSIDSLRHLREKEWFPGDPIACGGSPALTKQSCLLTDYAGELAEQYLEYAGHRVRLRSTEQRDRSAEKWRWLTLSLPPDVLVAALAARVSANEPPIEHVQLVSPQLGELLLQGCAETHLHRGAALPFSRLWAGLMAAMSMEKRLEFSKMPPPLPRGSAPQFELLLLAAAISRLLLAAFLHRLERQNTAAMFSDFLLDEKDAGLGGICEALPWRRSSHAASAWQCCLEAMDHVRCPKNRDGVLPIWRSLYRKLRGVPTAKQEREDPLHAWLVPQPGIATAETRLCYRGFRYLRTQRGQRDHFFALCFLQYQRVRFAVYRYLILTPGVAGLDWFTRYFDRISPLREVLSKDLMRVAVDTESRDLHLASLELRRSPVASWWGIRDQVREIAQEALFYQQRNHGVSPEMGLVLHFVKQHYGQTTRGRFLNGAPDSITARCRHGLWFRSCQAEADAMCRALRLHPELLLILRGIDAANTELAQPTWVLLPLWQQVRTVATQAAAQLACLRPSWQVPPLRSTIHAGEDFVRLVQGLRRIHEPIEFGLLQAGDRLGHALALGVKPERWAAFLFEAPQLLDERLDDLLWELERYQRGELPVMAARIEYVRAESLRLGRIQYGPQLARSTEELIEARRLRYQPALLRTLGFPSMRSDRFHVLRDPAHLLLLDYMTNPHAFARGQQPVMVRCDEAEVAMLKEAQRWLSRLVARMELTVESNPSSNLLIGAFQDITELPAFRMQPLRGQIDSVGHPVLLSINTDNPVTFASCLADEFSYVYYGLIRTGVSASEALDWIDRTRQAGYRSRFTLPASTLGEALEDCMAPRDVQGRSQRVGSLGARYQTIFHRS